MPIADRFGNANYTIEETEHHLEMMCDIKNRYITSGKQWVIKDSPVEILDVISTGPEAIIWLVARSEHGEFLIVADHTIIKEGGANGY